MPIEYEVKLPGEPEQLRDQLVQLGAEQCSPRLLEDDLVLDTAGRALAGAAQVLRLRRRGQAYLLTFKGPVSEDVSVKAREEWQTPVEDGVAMLAVFERLGYEVAIRYQKYRALYMIGEVIASVDETPLGCFVELEGAPAEIERLAGEMGYEPGSFEVRSYLEIHRDQGNRGDMLFDGPEAAPWLEGVNDE
jgi:adenylate cyclase class 2